jgi:hypothetical protein
VHHIAELLLESQDTPPFQAAHLRVEIALEPVIQQDDVQEVSPAQL